MNDDRENLNVLAVFHWVLAGLTALFSLLPVLHLVLGIAMFTGRMGMETRPDDLPIRIFGLFFIVFASVLILCGLALAVCLALTGRYLRRRRHYMFCLVTAGFACVLVPFGTVLGILTIIVLQKDSARALFAASPVAQTGL